MPASFTTSSSHLVQARLSERQTLVCHRLSDCAHFETESLPPPSCDLPHRSTVPSCTHILLLSRLLFWLLSYHIRCISLHSACLPTCRPFVPSYLPTCLPSYPSTYRTYSPSSLPNYFGDICSYLSTNVRT
jgi:hypothetical protein